MTPEQVEIAKDLHDNQSLCLELIAERLGVTRDTIRRALSPTYRARRNEAARQRRADKRLQMATGYVETSGVVAGVDNPIYDPRRDGYQQYRSLSDYLMGDPPVGRSALDQRGGVV